MTDPGHDHQIKMNNANNNVSKAKKAVGILKAKVVVVALETAEPSVVNSLDPTSVFNPSSKSWLLAAHIPVYLVALVKFFNSILTVLFL